MSKTFVISIIIVLTLLNIFQLAWHLFANRLRWDAIPTEEAALEVGKALIDSIYGKSEIYHKINVIYDKKRNAWYVYEVLPENYVGGRAGVLFRRSDGKILSINSGM